MLRVFFLCAALLGCSSQQFDQDGGDLKRSEVEHVASRLRDATEAEFPLLRHKLVTRYVDTLGQAIVSRNRDMPPLPYEFRVLKANEILAFSFPGGALYLSLGLLRAVEFEGQLAAAIAHELAHQKLGHQLVSWRRKVNGGRGQPYLVDFSGAWRDHFLGPRGALFLERAMEDEADALAPALLYGAGFDPRLYISYLNLLHARKEAGETGSGMLCSLHPPVAERIKAANASILALPPRKDPGFSSPTFQKIRQILKEAARRGAQPSVKKKEKP